MTVVISYKILIKTVDTTKTIIVLTLVIEVCIIDLIIFISTFYFLSFLAGTWQPEAPRR